MPSSTSSSDDCRAPDAPTRAGDVRCARAPAVRQTASDRPGVAQPVPVRDIPTQPWGRDLRRRAWCCSRCCSAAGSCTGARTARRPATATATACGRCSAAASTTGEGDATVLIGSSRMLFDVQLPVWEQLAGERPIQLALEGTSPVPVLEDLAADPNFTGRLLVGVAPDLFFSGFAVSRRRAASTTTSRRRRSASATGCRCISSSRYSRSTIRTSRWRRVVRRQPWPLRPGMQQYDATCASCACRMPTATRTCGARSKTIRAYRAMARGIWARAFRRSRRADMDTPAEAAEGDRRADRPRRRRRSRHCARAASQVLFLRPPSIGPYLRLRAARLPAREAHGTCCCSARGAPGIHFEDYPQLQGYDQPEWSHLSASEANALHRGAGADHPVRVLAQAAAHRRQHRDGGRQPRRQIRQRLLAGIATSSTRRSPIARASASTASASRMPERGSRAFSQPSNVAVAVAGVSAVVVERAVDHQRRIGGQHRIQPAEQILHGSASP